jgi:hypothetical protein
LCHFSQQGWTQTRQSKPAKATATPNAVTTHATKSDAEKKRHTRLTLTMKATMDKTLALQTKAMAISLTMNWFNVV